MKKVLKFNRRRFNRHFFRLACEMLNEEYIYRTAKDISAKHGGKITKCKITVDWDGTGKIIFDFPSDEAWLNFVHDFFEKHYKNLVEIRWSNVWGK